MPSPALLRVLSRNVLGLLSSSIGFIVILIADHRIDAWCIHLSMMMSIDFPSVLRQSHKLRKFASLCF